MKKVFILIVVLAVIAGGIGYYMYNKPVESLEKKKAEITITAEQLLQDYEQDENAANQKYLDKIVQVNGTIAEVTTEGGTSKIHFATSNPVSGVIAEMEDGSHTADLRAGTVAAIKGKCTGYLSDVILVRSTVVK